MLSSFFLCQSILIRQSGLVCCEKGVRLVIVFSFFLVFKFCVCLTEFVLFACALCIVVFRSLNLCDYFTDLHLHVPDCSSWFNLLLPALLLLPCFSVNAILYYFRFRPFSELLGSYVLVLVVFAFSQLLVIK